MTTDKIPFSPQMSMFPPQPDIMAVAQENAHILSSEFMEWLPENIHVWDAFVYEVFRVIHRGRKHYGARTIVEVLRHNSNVSDTTEPYKINDHSIPYLSRLFDAAYPQHAGLFEYRTTTKKKAA